jgi:hypothetical protein
MTGDNGRGLRALFYGLCALHGIEVLDMQEAGAMPSDFCVVDGKFPCHVVILPEPADRQVEISSLRHRGVPLLILNRQDLEDFRMCPNPAVAEIVIGTWLRNDTRAAAERRRMGLD